MIDLLYVCWNRLAYTQASFQALVENTDWSHVRGFFVADDHSTDGTTRWLEEQIADLTALDPAFADTRIVMSSERRGGPVAAMNWYLDWHERNPDGPDGEQVEIFAKVDNDFVVCPGWLSEMLKVTSLHPEVDALGVEPRQAPAKRVPWNDRHPEPARHIGGKGLIRHRIFEGCRPRPHGFNGYQGWSQYQIRHPNLTYAWISPDLACFGLDQLPFEPWVSLAEDYTARKWHRAWPAYDALYTGYWDWWVKKQKEAAR